jgi:outer membrane protein assembly factor BamE (lipoprotein component of BamABCDE complex)
MKSYWLVLSAVCVAGCVSNSGLQYDTVSTTNLYHMARIRKGMNETQVLQVMRQPYDYETFELEEDVYDVWFYVTNPTVLGQSRMVAQNLTPLSFKNGILVGTGYDYYYFIIREEAKQRAAAMPPAPAPTPPVQPRAVPAPQTAVPQTAKPPVQNAKPDQPENTELENSLQKAVKPTTPTPTQQRGDLQNTPKPTAPILSSSMAPPISTGTMSSLFAARDHIFDVVQTGMYEMQVQDILGEPADSETLQLGTDIYTIWFYDMPAKRKKGATTRIPLTFKNGILVGKTTDYYNGIKESASHDQMGNFGQEGQRTQEQESEQNFDYW